MFCIELTSHCNFSCVYCPMRWMTRKKQHINYQTAVRSLKDIAGHKLDSTVGFHVMGEPMLYPRFDKVLAYAKTLQLKTVLVTNGSLLTPARIKRIAPHLDQIIISVNGNSPSLHALRGGKVSFGTYSRRIQTAVCLLLEKKVSVTLSYMTGSLTKQKFICTRNEEETVVQAWLRRTVLMPKIPPAKEKSRTDFVKTLQNETGGKCLTLPCGLNILFRPVSPLWAGESVTGKQSPPADPSRRCTFTPSVLSSGQFVLCCGDFDGRMSIGNASTMPVHEILKQNRLLIKKIASLNDRGLLFERACTGCSPRTSPRRITSSTENEQKPNKTKPQ